jgi:hypothetical protein
MWNGGAHHLSVGERGKYVGAETVKKIEDELRKNLEAAIISSSCSYSSAQANLSASPPLCRRKSEYLGSSSPMRYLRTMRRMKEGAGNRAVGWKF